MDADKREYIAKQARECLECVVMYVHATERLLMFRQVMLFANFYGYGVFLITVITWSH